jgi:hypothetical protein
MPRWVLVPAVVAGLASFGGGALVGARSNADARSAIAKPAAQTAIASRTPARSVRMPTPQPRQPTVSARRAPAS